jgi:hypothetical protein
VPQGSYGLNDLVYIYDLTHLAYGTVILCRQWRDDEGNRHEEYGVLLLNGNSTVTCAVGQLRRACWTFTGPVIVSGGDVIENFGIRRPSMHSPMHVHWHKSSRPSAAWGRMLRNIAGVK